MSIRTFNGTWLLSGSSPATSGDCCCDNEPCSGPCDEENPCPAGCYCCDGVCQDEACCPAYPVTVYITGGLVAAGGYRSLEIQAVDDNGTRVYDWRDNNGGSFSGSRQLSNGLTYGVDDGCEPVSAHVFTSGGDPPEDIYDLAVSDYYHTVDPANFECCATFEGGVQGAVTWCDNPQGTCEDDPP